jgi:MYXO-CTERM domain-containing protein
LCAGFSDVLADGAAERRVLCGMGRESPEERETMKKVLGVCALAMVAIAGQASAAVIYDSNGFEAPTFGLGTIENQNGWFVDPAGQATHQVVGPTVVGGNTVNPASGGQMVRITQTTGTRFSFPDITAGVASRPAGQDWVINNFDIFAPSGQTSTAFFGVLAFNSSVVTIGGARLRASDGALIVTLDPDGAGPMAFSNYTIGVNAPFNTWVNLGLAVNVATNQVAVLSGSSVLISGTGPGTTATATLSDFDLISGSNATLTNSMFVDNYIVKTDTTAPAPGALGVLGLAGLVAGRRRR